MTIDMSFICRICGTDTREGSHATAEPWKDGNGVTFSCVVPRQSSLPRVISYIDAPSYPAEYYYSGSRYVAR